MEIIKTEGKARRGIFETPHGTVQTPAFMNVATAAAIKGGISYTAICCIGTLGVFMGILCERLLQATGRTMHTMITQSTGAIVNIILDPILIHGWLGMPAMGIAGAAWATVIGQWVSGLLALYFNIKFIFFIYTHFVF